MRIEFVCGNRALIDYSFKNNIVNKGSSILSVKDIDIINGIERINGELMSFKKENKFLKEQLIEYEAKQLFDSCEKIEDVSVIRTSFINRDFDEIRQLAATLVNSENSIALLGNSTDDKTQIILSRSKQLNTVNMKNVFNEVIPLLDGKGGGNQFSAQGGGKSSENLDKTMLYAFKLITDKLQSK